MIRRDLTVPISAILLALAALIGGWTMFVKGSPRVIEPPERVSHIGVVTDDPQATVDVRLSLPLDFGEIYEDIPPPLILDITFKPSKASAIKWAIILTDDVGLPWSTDEPAGSALPSGGDRAFDDVWVQGDVEEAWFVRNAGESEDRTPSMLGSIIFGTTTSPKRPHALTVEVVGPTDRPMVADSGQNYTMYLPSMGIPGEGSSLELRSSLKKLRQRPTTLLIGEAGIEGVPGQLQEGLEKTAWHYPSSYTLTAEASGQKLEDRLVQASQPPAGPTTWRWRARDHLFVQAFAERPSWIARSQRLQFLAGVLAGIGGGFLIWSLELWYGVVAKRPEGDTR